MKVKCIERIITPDGEVYVEKGDIMILSGTTETYAILFNEKDNQKNKKLVDFSMYESHFIEFDEGNKKCQTCNFIKSIKEYYKDNSVSIGVEFTIFTYTDLEKEIQNSKTALKSGIYNYCPECGHKID